MSYSAIMAWDNSNRVAKLMDFPDQNGADAHIAVHVGNYPGAFSVETPSAPVSHWLVDPNGPSVSISPPAPLQEEVQAERERRLALGFAYDFGDARGVHQIGTTPEDMVGWRDVIDYANALIDTGDTTTQITIVTDTGPTAVTAPEWQAIMLQAAVIRQTIWAGSFTLQAMSPIPSDYMSDIYWE